MLQKGVSIFFAFSMARFALPDRYWPTFLSCMKNLRFSPQLRIRLSEVVELEGTDCGFVIFEPLFPCFARDSNPGFPYFRANKICLSLTDSETVLVSLASAIAPNSTSAAIWA